MEDITPDLKDDSGLTSKTVGGEVQRTTESGKRDNDNPLKLRLDLNLDVDIQLKAKIRGDITLSLL